MTVVFGGLLFVEECSCCRIEYLFSFLVVAPSVVGVVVKWMVLRGRRLMTSASFEVVLEAGLVWFANSVRSERDSKRLQKSTKDSNFGDTVGSCRHTTLGGLAYYGAR